MKEQIKELILKNIKLSNGIKNVDLVIMVINHINPARFESNDYHMAYEELLSDGEIIRLEYTDPVDSLRAKTLLFAKGTRFLNLGEIYGQKRADQTKLVR